MSRRASWAVIGLAVLLAIDVLLVALVFRAASPAPSDTAAPARGDVGAMASPTETPPLEETESSAVEPPAPLARIVAAVDDNTVWVAEVGSCDVAGRIHVTTSGGGEWSTHVAPGMVTRIRPTGAGAGFIVGGGDDCEAGLWYTSDGGATWGDRQPPSEAWGRDPANSQLVLRPGGDPARPCTDSAEVLDLTGLDRGQAGVACSDGTVVTTTDRGSTWSAIAQLEGLVALSLSAPGSGIAAIRSDGCEGVDVVPLQDGAPGSPVCVADAVPAPGMVAVSLAGSRAWLVAGDGIFRSNEDLTQFEQVGSWPAS